MNSARQAKLTKAIKAEAAFLGGTISDERALEIAERYENSPRGREMAALRAQRERETAEIESAATA